MQSFNLKKYEDIFQKLDHIFVDIKNMDSNNHKEYTSFGNELILENIIKMAKINKSMVIRIPVIPGFNDDIENITSTSQFVKKNIKSLRIELPPYHMFAYINIKT
ncbi:hypothetical protein [Terrisporobacter glycolicus]|uniref:4-hydroxyphenylacetate decarboxylase activating enzyme n=1 Tax=Terrisporobacter glycolicus ATCC 14880 = DSM 1288 TaxID=1121315 RepID=A0ABZ2EXW5_9FIRM|nr:hypothetical protein [Terrisporobacter glycolicus]